MPLGLRGGGGDGVVASPHTSPEYWKNGTLKGSHTLDEVTVPCSFSWYSDSHLSHSYSAPSSQYRLPLLTSLIAFSQCLGDAFDESIKTICIAKQA